MSGPEMTEADVCAFLELVEALGIDVWLDGGWAVDAWLGGQTRRHADIDIVIETRHLATLVDALRRRGYDDIPRDDSRPWNFVLGDAAGHEVDFHVIELAQDGSGLYGLLPSRSIFPADSLTAVAHLCGREIRAIPPHRLVEFHAGYDPDENDRADVLALCARFGIEVPASYRRPLDM
jgi:lincosamide nucleotidyltransferase A/C/D/E